MSIEKIKYIKVYEYKENTRSDLEIVLIDLQEGDLIKKFGEVQRYKCIARNNRYIVLAKPYNIKQYKFTYIIFDLETFTCNIDNLMKSKYNYLDRNNARTAIRNLERGRLYLAFRGLKDIDDFVERVMIVEKRKRKVNYEF